MLGAKSPASAGNGAEIGKKGREMGEEKHSTRRKSALFLLKNQGKGYNYPVSNFERMTAIELGESS